jgi:hypothetical protein
VEIEIDEGLVRGIIAQETVQAAAEIEQLGPVAAYENSRARHDARVSAAPDAHTLACKNGCFWCCYFTSTFVRSKCSASSISWSVS